MKERKQNAFSLTRSDLIEVIKMSESAVTEAVIAAIIQKDKNVADDDNNEADSSVLEKTDMKKCTKS